MKFADIIPIQLVIEKNGVPTGETCDIELRRNEYVACRRMIRKLGLPPMKDGGFSAIIAAGLQLVNAERVAENAGGAR